MKTHLGSIALALTLPFLPNFGLTNTSEALAQDIFRTVKTDPHPLHAVDFLNRRLGEWLIGVYAPDYVPSFPKQDYGSYTGDHEFKALITFGDSLTDQGNHSRSTLFLAGGYHNQLFNEILSLTYTGKHQVPSNFGGTDYGDSGAPLKNRGGPFIGKQIDEYLNRNGGQARPDNLYLLTAGSMDINRVIPQVIINAALGHFDFTAPDYTFDDAPRLEAQYVDKLRKAGATYVLVGNLPDPSITPYSPMIPVEMISDLLHAFHLPDLGIVTFMGKYVDDYIRNPANQIPSSGREHIRLNGQKSLHHLLWFLPKHLTDSLYDFLGQVQSIPVRQFNHTLEKELEMIGGEVVFFDFSHLVDEVIADPKRYGFDETLVPTCDLGFSARYCEYGSSHYHQDKTYLFGDWFHPSPQMHALIASYIISIFDAPLYVNSVADQILNIDKIREDFLENQLFTVSHTSTPGWKIFAGYGGLLEKKTYHTYHLSPQHTYTHTLNIGAYTPVNDHFLWGLLFTGALGNAKPFQNYRFGYRVLSADLFTFWRNDQGFWAKGDVALSYLWAQNAVRSIQLGNAVRQEKTHSLQTSHYSVHALAGYNWIKKPTYTTGPEVKLTARRISLQDSCEKNNTSTSMRFKKFHYQDFKVGIGWYIATESLTLADTPVKLLGSVYLDHHLGKDKFTIKGGLKSTQTSFYREIKLPEHTLAANFNADFQLNKLATLNTYLSAEGSDNHDRSWGLGISYQHKLP